MPKNITFCNKCGLPDNYKGKDKKIIVCNCIKKKLGG